MIQHLFLNQFIPAKHTFLNLVIQRVKYVYIDFYTLNRNLLHRNTKY